MNMNEEGARDALVKLGLARPRFMDEPDERVLTSPDHSPSAKMDYYRNYLQDVSAHELGSPQEYTDYSRAGARVGGGMLGALGGGLAGGVTHGGKGALIGALGAGLLGVGAGHAAGPAIGRGMREKDTARMQDASGLLQSDPAMQQSLMRETEGLRLQQQRAALAEQRKHDAAVRAQYLAAAEHMTNKFAPERE